MQGSNIVGGNFCITTHMRVSILSIFQCILNDKMRSSSVSEGKTFSERQVY